MALTKRHDGQVFSSELAGDCDFLPQSPTAVRDDMVSGSRRVVTHLYRATTTNT